MCFVCFEQRTNKSGTNVRLKVGVDKFCIMLEVKAMQVEQWAGKRNYVEMSANFETRM